MIIETVGIPFLEATFQWYHVSSGYRYTEGTCGDIDAFGLDILIHRTGNGTVLLWKSISRMGSRSNDPPIRLHLRVQLHTTNHCPLCVSLYPRSRHPYIYAARTWCLSLCTPREALPCPLPWYSRLEETNGPRPVQIVCTNLFNSFSRTAREWPG